MSKYVETFCEASLVEKFIFHVNICELMVRIYYVKKKATTKITNNMYHGIAKPMLCMEILWICAYY